MLIAELEKKYGKVDIVEAIPLSKELSEHNRNKHCSMSSQEELKSGYNEPYAWGMKIYKQQRKCVHPKGAIILIKEKIGDINGNKK